MSDDKDSKFVPENSTNEIMRMMREKMTSLVVSYDTMIKQHEDNTKLLEKYDLCAMKVDSQMTGCMGLLSLCTSAESPSQFKDSKDILNTMMQKLSNSIEHKIIVHCNIVINQKIEQDALLLYHSHVNHLFHYTIEICKENIRAVRIVREMKEEMKKLNERLERISDTQEALQRNNKKKNWGFGNSYTVEEMD